MFDFHYRTLPRAFITGANECISPFVSEPRTTIIGNDEMYIEAGSTINLTCTIQTGPTTDALIYWNYNGKVQLLTSFPLSARTMNERYPTYNPIAQLNSNLYENVSPQLYLHQFASIYLKDNGNLHRYNTTGNPIAQLLIYLYNGALHILPLS